MTDAVCIRCGATKLGALTSCSKCHFDPQTNEDKAKAMILTDHFLSKPDLASLSERIKTGQPVTYPQEPLDEYVKMFEENPNLGRMSTLAKIVCSLSIAAIIALVVWMLMRIT